MATDPTQMDRIALPGKQAYVTGISTPVIPCTANLPISLIDHIVNLFHAAGKIDAQGLPYTNPTPPNGGTAMQTRCVKQLFELDSEGLAREAYCFVPADYDAADVDRPSFKQFQKQWEREYGKSGKGDGRFPEVRKRTAVEPFSRCILRCMCDACRHGEAAELQCDTYDFGNDHMVSNLALHTYWLADISKILVHQFHWDNRIWAMILGTRDHPEEYSIWGKIDAITKQIFYHDQILLEEVSSTKTPMRSDGGDIDAGEDDDFTPQKEIVRKRKDASTALIRSKRRRTVAETASVEEPAWNGRARSGKAALYTAISDDDEEDFKPSEQTTSRRKTIAGLITDDSSAVTPGPASVSQPRHATPVVEQSHAHDLQKAFVHMRAHVNSQVDSDGLPVILSNAGIERYMRGLEVAASKNNSYLFGSMRAMIDEELAKVGLPALPVV